MDALVSRQAPAAHPEAAATAAQDFAAQALGCEETVFKSVGCGDDYRFKAPRIAGSALVHRDVVIHAAFFHLDPATAEGHMSELNRRRSYRVY
jgi:hypothetical protein